MKLLIVCLTFLWLCSDAVLGAIVSIALDLDPSPTTVHFVKGYLHTPATIDLSGMKFVTTDDAAFFGGDDDDDDDKTPGDATTTSKPTHKKSKTKSPTISPTASPTAAPVDTTTEWPTEAPMDTTTEWPTEAPVADLSTEAPTKAPTKAPKAETTDAPSAAEVVAVSTDAPSETPVAAPVTPTDNGNDGGGNRERLLLEEWDIEGDDEGRILDEAAIHKKSVLDLVLFRLPSSCASSKEGCNWADLGVGAPDDEQQGGISYCCSQDAYERDICTRAQKNRLIINQDKFSGKTRKFNFPATGETVRALDGKRASFNVKEEGAWVLVMANCNEYGREVMAIGKMEWKQERGFLPGDLYGLMNFYIVLSFIYLVTMILYGLGMKMYQESMIPIQRYIVVAIALGLLELSFRALDLHYWDVQGERSVVLMYPAIVVGVLKRGISRCLMVMVAMGWGVVRDTLGPALYQIILLGLIYTGLSGFRDIFEVVAVTEVHSISTTEEDELIDLVFILTTVIIAINLIFYFWIMNNLKATTVYLESMNQSSKLKRHNMLRMVIMISMVFAAGWLALQAIDFLFDVLTQDQEWILEASVHINYVFVLTCVAVLWRPNPNAKEYAFVMELNMDDTDGENDLELSTVPTAYDGNDPDHPNGLAADDGNFT